MMHEVPLSGSIPLATVTATNGDHITIQMPPILPCLRCGGNKITILNHFFDGDTHTKYQCMCEKYHAWDEWLDTKAEAIAAWNERPIYIMTSSEVK